MRFGTTLVVLATSLVSLTGASKEPKGVDFKRVAWSEPIDAFFTPVSGGLSRRADTPSAPAPPPAAPSVSSAPVAAPSSPTSPPSPGASSNSTSFKPDAYIIVLASNSSTASFLPILNSYLAQHAGSPPNEVGYVYDPRILNGFSGRFDKAAHDFLSGRADVAKIYSDTVMSIQAPAGRPNRDRHNHHRATSSQPPPPQTTPVSDADRASRPDDAGEGGDTTVMENGTFVQSPVLSWGLARVSRRDSVLSDPDSDGSDASSTSTSPDSESDPATSEDDASARARETTDVETRLVKRDEQRTMDYWYRDPAGEGVQVFVLDTGVRATHEDFGGRAELVAEFGGYELQDGNGHGTHCAGTVAGRAYGVSKAVSLRGVKVLGDDGLGSSSDIIAGLQFVVSQFRSSNYLPTVASLSFGGPRNPAVDQAVENAVEQGVHVVVAAGNEGEDACEASPAAARTAVTVGATDIDDNEADYSNWGECVDILAPGTDITSTWIDSDSAVKTISGTSMATPHVAGLVAYFLSERNVSTDDMAGWLEATATKGAVKSVRDGTPNLLAYNDVGR